MRELVPGAGIVHKCSFLDFVRALVDHVALIRKHRSDVVLLLLSSDEENLVLGLDGSELLRQDIVVPYCDFDCGLSVQLMNEQRFLFLVIVV